MDYEYSTILSFTAQPKQLHRELIIFTARIISPFYKIDAGLKLRQSSRVFRLSRETTTKFSQMKMIKLMKRPNFRVILKDFLSRHLEQVFSKNEAFQKEEDVYRDQVSLLLGQIDGLDAENE